MNYTKCKYLTIAGMVVGGVLLYLYTYAKIFALFGCAILCTSIGLFFYFKGKEKDSNIETNIEIAQENKDNTTSNLELSKYRELISNTFDIDGTESNFQCSLMLMALYQIKENPYYNAKDLSFNIDDMILKLDNFRVEKFLNSKNSSFVALDTETTGLSADNDRIIQIALVKFEKGVVVDKFVSYVNPKRHIKNDASEINSIYDEDVKDAKTIKELFPTILEFIGKYPIVMHNSQFDMSFLKSEYFRSFNKEMPRFKTFCTMKMWRKLFYKHQGEDVPSAKLYTLVLNLLNNQEQAEYKENKHTAYCDAYTTGKVFMKMYDNDIDKN